MPSVRPSRKAGSNDGETGRREGPLSLWERARCGCLGNEAAHFIDKPCFDHRLHAGFDSRVLLLTLAAGGALVAEGDFGEPGALAELSVAPRKFKQALLRTNLRDHLQSA